MRLFVFVSKPGSFLRSLIGSRLPRRCGPHPLPAKRETRPLPSDNDPERERARRGRRRSSAPVRPRQTPSHRTPDRARALSAREPASAASAGRLPPQDPHQPCLLLTEMRAPDGRPNPAAGSPPYPPRLPNPRTAGPRPPDAKGCADQESAFLAARPAGPGPT